MASETFAPAGDGRRKETLKRPDSGKRAFHTRRPFSFRAAFAASRKSRPFAMTGCGSYAGASASVTVTTRGWPCASFCSRTDTTSPCRTSYRSSAFLTAVRSPAISTVRRFHVGDTVSVRTFDCTSHVPHGYSRGNCAACTT